MPYKQAYEGEVIFPARRGYKMQCCDCGLVHRMDFGLVRHGHGKSIYFRSYRDERATAAVRRERRKHGKKGTN
jgi:hypothetical protein